MALYTSVCCWVENCNTSAHLGRTPDSVNAFVSKRQSVARSDAVSPRCGRMPAPTSYPIALRRVCTRVAAVRTRAAVKAVWRVAHVRASCSLSGRNVSDKY
jgi:hypothetical protein